MQDSTLNGCVLDSVPGFVPRLLRDPDVSLFRADERVFDAMLDGWRAQMLARGLATATIKARCAVVSRFQAYVGEFPWNWRPVDVEDFLADLRSRDKPISLTTLRAYSNGVSMFCACLTHRGYGWSELCERTFGNVPSRICFDWNMPRHTTDDAVPPSRRSFTRAELQHLFDPSTTLWIESSPLGRNGGCRSCVTRSPSRFAMPTAFAGASSRCST